MFSNRERGSSSQSGNNCPACREESPQQRRLRIMATVSQWDDFLSFRAPQSPINSFCSRHQKWDSEYDSDHCALSGCSTEIPAGYYDKEDGQWKYGKVRSKYCANHRNTCLAGGCFTGIATEQKYCVKHTVSNANQTCQHKGKLRYWWIENSNSCYEKVVTSDGYCRYHEKQCESCLERVMGFQNYCFDHEKACVNCSARVNPTQGYCSNCETNNRIREEEQQIKEKESEQTKLTALVKAKTSIASVIKEVERFSTDWNKNLATVIASDGNYWVFLLVLDSENNSVKVFPVSASESKWGTANRGQHSSLTSAQSEANWLQNKLKYDSNPILVIHPKCDSYTAFSNIVCEPYVKFYNSLPYNTSNWDNYLKPLDIIKVRKENTTWGKRYYHVGVYLGNNQVSHIYDSRPDTRHMKARIDDVSIFLGDASGTRRVGNMEAIHPVIPFKNWKEIIRNIAWVENVEYWKGNYNLGNRNCAHLAHMLGYGINYSDEVEQNKHLFTTRTVARGVHTAGTGIGIMASSAAIAPITGGASLIIGGVLSLFTTALGTTAMVVDSEINNGNGSSICLKNEISKTKNKLEQLNNQRAQDLEARLQVPPKQECRIM